MNKLCKSILLLIILILATALPALAAQLLTGGGMITVTEKEVSCRVDTHILIGNIAGQEPLTSSSTALGIMPVAIREKNFIEFRLSAVGLDKFGEEIGITPDKGLTRYPAVKTQKYGYIVRVPIDKSFPLGLTTFEWYGAHWEGQRIVSIFIFSFTFEKKSKVSGGIFIHICNPPQGWDEMSYGEKISFLHGGMPTEAWSNNPQIVAAGIQARQKLAGFGKLIIRNPNSGERIEVQTMYCGSVLSKFFFGRQIEFDCAKSGMQVRARTDGGNWSNAVIIQKDQTSTIQL